MLPLPLPIHRATGRGGTAGKSGRHYQKRSHSSERSVTSSVLIEGCGKETIPDAVAESMSHSGGRGVIVIQPFAEEGHPATQPCGQRQFSSGRGVMSRMLARGSGWLTVQKTLSTPRHSFLRPLMKPNKGSNARSGKVSTILERVNLLHSHSQ